MTALLKSELTKVYPGLCPGCPLNKALRVGGRGNIEAPLVVVGEAPGAQELREGLPFIGPSGQVFEQCLPLGFDVDDKVLVVNAMQCCPPKSNNQNKDKQQKLQCVNACRSGVQELIWAHPRKVLLVMGNWAAVHLLGDMDFKITKRRGEIDAVYDPIRGDVVQIVYSMHPASLLHGRGSPKDYRADVLLAISLAYGNAVAYGSNVPTAREGYTEPKHEVLWHWQQVWLLVLRIRAYGRKIQISADTETHTLRPYNGGHVLCLGLYGEWDDNVAQVLPWECLDDPMYAMAVNTLLGENVHWIWQNGKFDLKFLRLDPRVKVLPTVDDDTLLMSYAQDEASKAHDLEVQGKNLLGAPDYSHKLKPYLPNKATSYAVIPRPVLYEYLGHDVKITYQIAQIHRRIIDADEHTAKLYYKTLLPVQYLLTDMEIHGIEVDLNNVAKNRRLLERAIAMTGRAIDRLAGKSVNPNSPAQVATWLYDEVGLTIKGKRPTSTDKDTMDMLPNHPAAKLIKTYRRLSKMLSTYVKSVEDLHVNGRIHTSFKLHSTTTGRPASAEPNILNIPREARYRRMYCAKKNYILLEADYNTAELRGLAVLSGDKALTEIFLDGKRNLHDEVSIKMYGPDFTPDQRIRSKAVNFGIPYGRSAYTLADEYGIPVKEGQAMIDGWFAMFPGAKEFLDRCRAAPLRGKSLLTPFGRRRRPGLVSKERIANLQNEFCNFFFQSMFSNDFTMHAAMRMHPEIKALGGHLVNTPYDSTVLEVPDDPETVRECARIQKYYMEHTPTLYITTPIQFIVDQKCGTHWGDLTKLDKWLAKRNDTGTNKGSKATT